MCLRAWSTDMAGLSMARRSNRARHGLGIGEGAWGKHGAGGVYGQGSGGTDRMRGDGVGVGDIDEVHGGTRSSGHPTGGDDGRGSRCECV